MFFRVINSNFFSGIFPYLLSAAVAVFAVLYYPRSRRRAVWTFDTINADVTPGIIIDHVRGEQTQIYKRPSTGYGAVLAVAQISNSLNASRSGLFNRAKRFLAKPINVCFATDQTASDWIKDRDVVLVGGPKNNPVTARMLRAWSGYEEGETPSGLIPADDTSRSLRVWTVGNKIHWFGECYEGTVADSDPDSHSNFGYSGIDYGIVIRIPNPSTLSRHRMVILFGSQTFGIIGATDWLVGGGVEAVQDAGSSWLHRHFKGRSRNVAALLKCYVSNGVIESTTVVDFQTLDGDSELEPAQWG